MFEKEAEEYLKKDGTKAEQILSLMQGKIKVKIKQLPFILAAFLQTYQDGAEFGYNKANEWHYVKDELPKDNEYVLIYTDLNNCYVAKKVENHFMSKGWGFIPMSTVIAWKEIVLPELPKEIE